MPNVKQQYERIACLLRLMKENSYPNYQMVLKEMQRQDVAIHFSRKTLLRDVEYLRSAFAAPVEYDASHQGYYLSDPNWSGFRTILEEKVMEAAVIGAHLAEMLLPPSEVQHIIRQGTDALWAQNNISEAQSYAILPSFVIAGGYVQIKPEVFQTIFEQWRSQHGVSITYISGQGKQRTFEIEPHALARKDNVWYVHARLLAGDPKKFYNYAMHRIQAAVPLGRSFIPDYEEIERVNKGRLFNLPCVKGVKLELVGLARKLPANTLPVEATEECAGSAVVTLGEIEEFRVLNFVLSSNGEADILEPVELREKAREMAARDLETLQRKVGRGNPTPAPEN